MKIRKFTALMLSLCFMLCLIPADTYAAQKQIQLSRTAAEMRVGQTETLRVRVSGVEKPVLGWASSDPSVVSVTRGGVVTAHKAGRANIVVRVRNTNLIAQCRITVRGPNAAVTPAQNVPANNNTENTAQEPSTPSTPAGTPSRPVSSSERAAARNIVANMKVGWNLGNTFDAHGGWTSGLSWETAWGNPKTTRAMINEIKKAGFNTLRVPVTWYPHLDHNDNIDAEWMKRVKEVVDYGIANNMYVILNTHHEGSWLIPTRAQEAEVTVRFTRIWEQIAEEFKGYNNRLIFEGMNEPRIPGSPREWQGGTEENRAVINNLHQVFVNTVRASGGNNATRLLMVTTHNGGSGQTEISGLRVPNDKNIIVSINTYAPYSLALDTHSPVNTFDQAGKKTIDDMFNRLQKTFLDKGIPVIITEFGYLNKNNEAARSEAAAYYVKEARKRGIPCIWWDNGSIVVKAGSEGFAIFDRNKLKWHFPRILDALIKNS